MVLGFVWRQKSPRDSTRCLQAYSPQMNPPRSRRVRLCHACSIGIPGKTRSTSQRTGPQRNTPNHSGPFRGWIAAQQNDVVATSRRTDQTRPQVSGIQSLRLVRCPVAEDVSVLGPRLLGALMPRRFSHIPSSNGSSAGSPPPRLAGKGRVSVRSYNTSVTTWDWAEFPPAGIRFGSGRPRATQLSSGPAHLRVVWAARFLLSGR